MTSESGQKEKFYETIAEDFDAIMNMYDTRRRISVIFEDFLGSEALDGKQLLDAGCGTGWFTRAAVEAGAAVTSLDIADTLVKISCEKNPDCRGVIGSLLDLPFKAGTFDYVISSEVIEHTPDPYRATDEMVRVLKPGGKMCVTVPNRSFWYFSVVLADKLGLRKYKGYENWVPYYGYKRFLESHGVELLQYKGIHLFPFVFSPLNGLLYNLDKVFEKRLGALMVNISAFAAKR